MPQKQQQTIFPPPEMMPRNLQTQASLNTCSQKLTTKISASSSSTTTTTHSSSSSACAACKYQRKKCSSDCLLAPYFPPTHQTEFLNTHKLFGVSNICKIIKSLDNPVEKETAMRSMIFQAEARARDPVGGCAHLIRDLQFQIARCKEELELVYHQIAMCRAAAQAQSVIDVNVNVVPPLPSDNEEDRGIINNQNLLDGYNHQNMLQQFQDMQHQRQPYNVIPVNQVVIQDYDDVAVLNQIWSMESLANQNDALNMIESKHAPSSISSSSPVMDDHNQQQQSSIEDPDVQ
ncbi:hypothetical protein C5167_021367 [Papaver somniferum]|uniref:LOB domain-containing protein n=1 Tax=Papaver somniferum TaxID=3469 RepID=A0A4Y7IWD2_PAPSO|nr:LOB domain-containing protein 22-like [Papaver somniferum]XP_026453646.1 LOB domain-containing protein 22-like [Papaver somniferum]RZC52947.1 hypothetical protein C5167_021367 [Papaver somniferum]